MAEKAPRAPALRGRSKRVNRNRIRAGALLLAAALASVLTPQLAAQGEAKAPAADITGAWSATLTTPMGEMEIVYTLKVTGGKITGTATMPFGESPIVDGAVEGENVHFTVQMDFFGNTVKAEARGKIVGDTLVLTPAMPPPPQGGGPDGAGPGAGGPPPGGGDAGGPPAGGFKIEPLTFHRKA
jgi:hypothetical protein